MIIKSMKILLHAHLQPEAKYIQYLFRLFIMLLFGFNFSRV